MRKGDEGGLVGQGPERSRSKVVIGFRRVSWII